MHRLEHLCGGKSFAVNAANRVDPLPLKMNLEQSLSGCQQPPGTRWSLQVAPQWPALQLSAENQCKQQIQACRAWQKLKPPMGRTRDHSRMHLGQALKWVATATRHWEVSPAPHQRAKISTFGGEPRNPALSGRPPAPGKSSNRQWRGPNSTPSRLWNNL